jgi:hypothetical protein
MKIYFFQHCAMTLEIAQHPFWSDLFVLDNPGAKINEQSFGGHNRRGKSYERTGLRSLEKVAATSPVQLIFKQVVDENIGVNENA